MAVQTVKVLINGTTHLLTYDEASRQYKATISAPLETSYGQNGEHYYPVSLTAIDDAGNRVTINDSNETFGDRLRLRVKEITKPTIEIKNPSMGSVVNATIQTVIWHVIDNESGIDTGSISLKFNGRLINSQDISITEIDGGYRCEYITSEMVDGTQTVIFNVTDNDGNRADEVVVTFTVDVSGPTLIVEEPADNFITNKERIIVSGRVDDISKPVVLTINETPVVIGSGGEFTQEIQLIEGANILTIVAKDSLENESKIVRIITLDTKPPIISEVTLKPNPVNVGQTYIITVTVVDP